MYKQRWYASINNSGRLKAYCSFKHHLIWEKYLLTVKANKYRVALTKFRVSSHDLAIETGRYTNTELKDRICQNCQMNTIEDEYHFILVCQKFRELRKIYLKPYYCHWPTLHKFENLMSTNSIQQTNNLAKFIYHAFKLRS